MSGLMKGDCIGGVMMTAEKISNDLRFAQIAKHRMSDDKIKWRVIVLSRRGVNQKINEKIGVSYD